MLISTAALCLALNIYHESRGEPRAGQIAVGMVTLNRADWDESRVCDVVFERGQWSWTNGSFAKTADGWVIFKDAQPREKKAWETSKRRAKRLLAEELDDPTRGATHFHTVGMRRPPRWASSEHKTATIGRHVFYRLD